LFRPPGPGGPGTPATPTPPTPGPSLAPSTLPLMHATTKRIRWSVDNPDRDKLIYRVYVREQRKGAWIELTRKEPTSSTSYVWCTESFPDGYYLVRVVASDERANPPGQATNDERISIPVLVDNGKPEVAELTADGGTLEVRGVVRDSFSAIRRIDYSLDGGEWLPVQPEDEILDELEERFRFKLPKAEKGAHTLTVRAFDSDSNMGVAGVTFEVK